MRVLITNDDGIAAPGLRHLAATAVAYGLETVVAAPLAEASGTSAGLSAVVRDGRVVVERRTLDGLEETPAYAVAASPGYIVILAVLGAFGPAPDVVLSGINRGANVGYSVLHSGTVGAALTAAATAAGGGRSALAVSLDVLSPAAAGATSGGAALAAIEAADDEARHWPTAAGLVREMLPVLIQAPAGTVLNLNVPDVAADAVVGLRRATLARFGQVQMAVAEAGEGFVRTAVEASAVAPEPGTDVALLAAGYATFTALGALFGVSHPTREPAFPPP